MHSNPPTPFGATPPPPPLPLMTFPDLSSHHAFGEPFSQQSALSPLAETYFIVHVTHLSFASHFSLHLCQSWSVHVSSTVPASLSAWSIIIELGQALFCALWALI